MKYIVMFLALPLLCGCTKKAVKQLEYDMLIAADNQTHITLESMEQDANIIRRKQDKTSDNIKKDNCGNKAHVVYPVTPNAARLQSN